MFEVQCSTLWTKETRLLFTVNRYLHLLYYSVHASSNAAMIKRSPNSFVQGLSN